MNPKYRNAFSMGTRLDAVFLGVSDKQADHLIERLKAEFSELENLLSNYRSYSELSRLNNKAYSNSVQVSSRLLDIITECHDYYLLTGGVFDPAGPATSPGEGPPEGGMARVVTDRSDNSVRYLDGRVKIDSGGFGKGLAIREARKILEAEGVENCLLSFGESSVLALGTHPAGDHWPVAVADIFNRHSSVRTARLVDRGMSTSGTGKVDKEGIFIAAGNIIDPRSGASVTEPRTVTFVSEDALEAEILSTALLVDNGCLGDDFCKTGREAFEVCYELNGNYKVNELL
ncbi:MAG: FAD:protein FMN transferase [Bacteroidales bacterium]|nr:FAD:protein FMN transferase [Bacteroidales bacterium]